MQILYQFTTLFHLLVSLLFFCFPTSLPLNLTAITLPSLPPYSPSYIATNLSKNAMTGSGDNYGRVDENTAKGYTTEAVADRLVEMILRDEPDVVMAPAYIQLAVVIRALSPALFFWLMRRKALKERQGKKE